MSIMRLCVVAVICAAAFAVAADTSASCTAPSSGKRLYANTTTGCAQAEACHAAYCSCVGGTRTINTGLSCMSGTANCTATAWCVTKVTTCLNAASDNTSCLYLRDLHLSILDVESGASLFNTSDAYTACKYQACVLVNATAGRNCNLTFIDLCPSPVSFIGTLILTGNFPFRPILTNAVQRKNLAVALAKDIAHFIGISIVRILRMWVHGDAIPARCVGSACRRASSEKLISEFEAVGVSGNNAALQSRITALKSSDASWLSATGAYFTEVNGAGATLGFGGVSAGGVSSAFASRGGLSAAATAIKTGSTTTSSTDSSTTSGAAVQSILAAVVVAVMSAMLF